MNRWNLLRFINRGGKEDAKMELIDDGPFVKYDDTLNDPREIAPDATSICIVFWSNENEAWIALAGDRGMSGLMAHGDTPQEAVSQWWIAHVAYVESLLHAKENR